jgi:hypothetical protein
MVKGGPVSTHGGNVDLQVGDRVRVMFGGRIVEGTVTSVRDGRVHVALEIEGSDELFGGLYRQDQLTTA